MRSKIQFSAVKNYFLGLFTAAAILGAGLYFLNGNPKNDAPVLSFSENFENSSATPANLKLSEFNPNDLTESEWKDLGFSDRQTATILKYKSVVGGEFQSKEQFKKCYAVSEEKYALLEPFLLLPETKRYDRKPYAPRAVYPKSYSNNYHAPKRSQIQVAKSFNPDNFSAEDFENMGFSTRQAESILKYKSYLGGSFISKEKFRECYMISEDQFKKMEPFLLLPDKTPVNYTSSKIRYKTPQDVDPIPLKPFDPNTITLQDWMDLGFSQKQAQVIINYRDRNLKGSFKSLEDIEKCFVISAEKFAQLKPYIVLNNESMKNFRRERANNNTTTPASTETITDEKKSHDYSKIDLNEITFNELTSFGFDDKGAASFVGFRKKLGGFVNTDQILETYNLDKNLAEKLIATAPLSTQSVIKYTLMEAPESWLKNHPYFKYYADKIIYYRITFSNEKKFFRTMNIKPEAEAKMKLYLR